MRIKIEGIEIDIEVTENIMKNAEAPILQPILRDTSPNALRAEQMKKDFNNQIFPELYKGLQP